MSTIFAAWQSYERLISKAAKMELYDTHCEDLAKYFLEDDETNTRHSAGIHTARVRSLAKAIQDAIEEWIDEEPT